MIPEIQSFHLSWVFWGVGGGVGVRVVCGGRVVETKL